MKLKESERGIRVFALSSKLSTQDEPTVLIQFLVSESPILIGIFFITKEKLRRFTKKIFSMELSFSLANLFLKLLFGKEIEKSQIIQLTL